MLHIRLARMLALALAVVFLALPLAAQEDVELRWRGKAGDVLRYRMTMTQESSMEMESAPDVPMGSATTSTMVLQQEVKEVSDEGVGTVEVSYEAIRSEIELAGEVKSYDSTLEGDARARNDDDLERMFEPLLSVTFRMQLEPSGHVSAFEGFEGVFDGFPAEMRTMMESMFSEDSLRRMFEVNVFPEEPLGIGDSWDRSMDLELPMMGKLEIAFESEVAGFDDHDGDACVHIDLSGTIDLQADSPVFEVTLDAGEFDGEMWFIRDTGYLIESTSTTYFAIGLESEGTSMDMVQRADMHMLRIAPDAPAFD